MKRLLLAFSVALMHCQGEVASNDVAEGEGSQAIVGGSITNGEPNVFFLVIADESNRQRSICTATLISKRTLLTAAHCVGPGSFPFRAKFFSGNGPNAPSQGMIGVKNVLLHPQYRDRGEVVPHDLALVTLDQEPPGITPAQLPPPNLGSLTGTAIRAVGYGTTSANLRDAGTKRFVTSTVAAPDAKVGPSTFGYGRSERQNGANGICGGDSGGPSFAQVNGKEVILGVHSFGYVGNCGWGADTRVDHYVTDFILPFLAANDPLRPALGPAMRLEIQPADRILRGKPGQVISIALRAFDVNNQEVPLTGKEWTASTSITTATPVDTGAQVALANKVGSYPEALKFQKDDASTSFQVVIEAGEAAKLRIERPAPMEAGHTFKLKVEAADAFGNDLSDKVSWNASGGTISVQGEFKAPMEAGTYEVTAQLESLKHTVRVQVNEVPLSQDTAPASSHTVQPTQAPAPTELESFHVQASASCSQVSADAFALPGLFAGLWALRRRRGAGNP